MSRISSMSQIVTLTGLEFIELIQLGTSANYAEAQANGFTGTLAEWETTYVNLKVSVTQLLANAGDGASAYEIAVVNGFVGTEAQWLASLVGKSAYQAAIDLGYVGTEVEWVASLSGKSAYEIAVEQGFVGTPGEWLASLVGVDGKSAFEIAADNGFIGTVEEWLTSLEGVDGQSAYALAVSQGFIGTQAEWIASLQGTNGTTAYDGAVTAGYVGTETQFYDALANVGQVGTDINGGIFITNVVPANPADNVGDIVRDGSNTTITSFSTTTDVLDVTVMAFTGHSNYRPAVTVNGLPVSLSALGGQTGVFQGTVEVTLGVGELELIATHEDGAMFISQVTMDQPPQITNANINTPYPGTQTELKENDTSSVMVTANVGFVAVELANFGIFKATTNTGLANVTSHVITGLVANRGNVRTAHSFQVRVQKANGSWSDWYDSSTSVEPVELDDFVYLNNLFPSVSIGTITYPATQTALKGSEQATVANTASNFDTIQYDSPNSQIAFLTSPSTFEASKVIWRIGGTYNITTANFRVVATRAANGAQTTQTAVVRISDVMPTIGITVPAARLRSGGNGGTVAQAHTVTLTSNQALSEAPTLNAPEGTWLGSWTPNGANTVWTRQLQVHDDNIKGTYSWNSLSAKTISGNIQTTINSGTNYVLGGFVFRTLQIPAYPNREVVVGAQITDVTKLRCTNLSKGESGSLNFTYNATTADAVDQFTITGPTGVANPAGTLWYNKDIANASSNTSGIMEIELEEVV